VYEAEQEAFKSHRRRSERLSQSFPLVVRGIDLLGQPFEERVSTLSYNLHGCRYSSKHHLPPNAWVTLETQQDGKVRDARARVIWSQRPQSVREFFQVAVELENPANIWGSDFPPADWGLDSSSSPTPDKRTGQRFDESLGTNDGPPIIGNIEGSVANEPFDSSVDASFAREEGFSPVNASFSSGEQSAAEGQNEQDPNPLLRDLGAELRRQAREAVEAAAASVGDEIRVSVEDVHQKRLATAADFFQTWKEEFERAQLGAREDFSEHLTVRQESFLHALKLKFEEGFADARLLLEELDEKAQTVRSEVQAVHQEAAMPQQTARTEQVGTDTEPIGVMSSAEVGQSSSAIARWNERVDLEMALAQSQWNELLQSSLDNGIQRLAAQLSEHSTGVLRSAEHKLSERFDELRQPLAETAAQAREVLNNTRAELEEEMARARASLGDIEHVAGRIKDYSSQLESSSHDTLNELHRRLENILESQTEELNRRAEHLVNGISQRLNPTIETLGHHLVERTIAEVESKLAPRLERVPELIRELSSREIQAEEGLRLHRERLRQVAENNQRDVAAQMAAALAGLHGGFEAAQQDFLAKWNEELNASGLRASHAASESIGQASEWFQQEARARLQVIVEQSLATAGSDFDGLASQSAQKFGYDLDRQSTNHLADAQDRFDRAASDIAARNRSQIDEAAQFAANSFGQVLRGISDQEIQQFTLAAQHTVEERARDLDWSAQQALGNLSAGVDDSLGQFRSRIASEVEVGVSQGRNSLSAEIALLLDRLAGERDTRQQEWAQGLDQLSYDATAKHQDRLQTACDSWLVSSVRRLNEHGQNTIESLMRVTDQALRDSCSKVFENLAEMMRDRERGSSSSAAGAFVPLPGRESSENSAPQ
jgi:hypothetical protein